MSEQMRDYRLIRGDGIVVAFRGRKAYQIGKAGIYETEGGNRVFQYAPHGNMIDLYVERIPSDAFLRQQMIAEHCTPIEMQGILSHLGQPTEIMIP